MKTDLSKILAISGQSGLYLYVSQARNGAIVEALADKKRTSIGMTNKITSLADISIYTDDEEVPLWQVLENVKAKCEGAACAVDHKKASNEELADFFAEVLPNYDRDRVYMSHVRKLIQWYNILVEAGMTEFVPEDAENEE